MLTFVKALSVIVLIYVEANLPKYLIKCLSDEILYVIRIIVGKIVWPVKWNIWMNNF